MKVPGKFSLSIIAFAFAVLLVPTRSDAQMLNWTTKLSPNFEEVRDAAHGAGAYVVVGDNNTLLYSSDAITWKPAKLPPGLSCDLRTVEFAFGQFFAGGKQNNTNKLVLLISLDGTDWTEVSDDFLRDSYDKTTEILHLRLAKVGSQKVLAASFQGTNYSAPGIRITADGINWSVRNTEGAFLFADDSATYFRGSGSSTWYVLYLFYGNPARSSSDLPSALTFFAKGNNTYVGVGSGRRLAYSPDTDSFIYSASPAITDYTGVAFGRDTFVAVGSNSAVVMSYDLGRSWQRASISNLQSVSFNGIRFVGDRFIAYGGGRIVTGVPVNKRGWSVAALPSGAKPISGLASNGKTIVAVGKSGQILYSATGASWSKALPATSNDLLRVVYDLPTKSFYATGTKGTLLRSSNGVRWSAVKTPGSGYYDGVARAGKVLLAAGGAKGQFLQSSDGKTWKAGKETLIDFAGSILGDGNAAYVFGPTGKFLIKRGNARNWITAGGAPSVLNDLAVMNKTIFATAADGRLFSTSQGKPGNWRSLDTRTSRPLNGIAVNSAAAKQLAAVGESGVVYSQPAKGRWRLEMIEGGRPSLKDILKFKNNWIVAGTIGNRAYIGYTNKN